MLIKSLVSSGNSSTCRNNMSDNTNFLWRLKTKICLPALQFHIDYREVVKTIKIAMHKQEINYEKPSFILKSIYESSTVYRLEEAHHKNASVQSKE